MQQGVPSVVVGEPLGQGGERQFGLHGQDGAEQSYGARLS